MRSLLSFIFFIAFTSTSIAADIGDRVLLKATHHDGVPVHSISQGTNNFERVPDQSEAEVIELANEGRWLKLRFNTGFEGWIVKKYVIRNLTSDPITPIAPPIPPSLLQQLHQLNFQGISKLFHVINADVSFTPFYRSNIGSV